jgi:hypothetical protein
MIKFSSLPPLRNEEFGLKGMQGDEDKGISID